MNDNDKYPVNTEQPADGINERARRADVSILIRDMQELVAELQTRIAALNLKINRLKFNL